MEIRGVHDANERKVARTDPRYPQSACMPRQNRAFCWQDCNKLFIDKTKEINFIQLNKNTATSHGFQNKSWHDGDRKQNANQSWKSHPDFYFYKTRK